MARQGRAGAALAIAALGSFFAGCVGTVLIAAFAPPPAGVRAEVQLGRVFLADGARACVAAVVLAHGSRAQGASPWCCVGLLLGLVGTDVNTGTHALHLRRLRAVRTASASSRWSMGLFGIGEIMRNLEQPRQRARADVARSGTCGRRRRTSRGSWRAVLRGTGLGSLLGILPGGGAVLASFATLYAREEDRAGPEPLRHAAPSRAWPARDPPTTRRRRPRSSRC